MAAMFVLMGIAGGLACAVAGFAFAGWLVALAAYLACGCATAVVVAGWLAAAQRAEAD